MAFRVILKRVNLSVIISCRFCAVCVIKGRNRFEMHCFYVSLENMSAHSCSTNLHPWVCAVFVHCVSHHFHFSHKADRFRLLKSQHGPVFMNICLVDKNLVFPKALSEKLIFPVHNLHNPAADVHFILWWARNMWGTDMEQSSQKADLSSFS